MENKIFSYPFNGDIENLQYVLNKYHQYIKEIYLPLPGEDVPTPRVSRYNIDMDFHHLYNLCANFNVKLNVLLNSAIRESKFYTAQGFDIIKKAIEKVIIIGINDITIGDLPLAMKVKTYFNDLRIHISATASVNSIPKFNMWKDSLGIYEVCIDTSKNKDLNFIRQLKKYGVKIKVLVNENCFLDCPMRSVHQNIIALRINAEDDFSCKALCKNMKLLRPWYIYQSGCINPYTLYKYYNGLVDTVKFVGRSKNSRDNLLTLENFLNKDSRNYFFRENEKVFFEPEGIFETVTKCKKYCDTCNFCENKYSGN